MTAAQTPKRVRAGYVARLSEQLSKRDWQILRTVNHLHLATGSQLDRLFFGNLSGRSRISSRSRALSRLVLFRVLDKLPRRIGGAKRGSSVAIYSVGSAGKQLLLLDADRGANPVTIRKSAVPGERFILHVLAVSELYVQLVEAHQARRLILRQFTTEPAAWWPNERGGWLKPDAFFVVGNGRVDHVWWLELDRASESVPTVGRKLRAYLDFVNRGGLGPHKSVPRVLISVPDAGRQAKIQRLVQGLPVPATDIVEVVTHLSAVPWLTGTLT